MEPREEDCRINTSISTKQAVIVAIKEIKNEKSPGVDQISLEMLKANPSLTEETRHFLWISERNMVK